MERNLLRHAWVLAALLSILLIFAGCGDEERGRRGEYGQRTDQQIAGARIFRERCSHCHGDKGSGGRMTRPLKRRTFAFGGGKEEIMRTIREGRPQGMPAFGGALAEDQIEALATYVLWLQ